MHRWIFYLGKATYVLYVYYGINRHKCVYLRLRVCAQIFLHVRLYADDPSSPW